MATDGSRKLLYTNELNEYIKTSLTFVGPTQKMKREGDKNRAHSNLSCQGLATKNMKRSAVRRPLLF
jgi:hypothetical protein